MDLKQYPDYAEAIKNPMDFGTIKRWVFRGALGVHRLRAATLHMLHSFPPLRPESPKHMPAR